MRKFRGYQVDDAANVVTWYTGALSRPTGRLPSGLYAFVLGAFIGRRSIFAQVVPPGHHSHPKVQTDARSPRPLGHYPCPSGTNVVTCYTSASRRRRVRLRPLRAGVVGVVTCYANLHPPVLAAFFSAPPPLRRPPPDGPPAPRLPRTIARWGSSVVTWYTCQTFGPADQRLECCTTAVPQPHSELPERAMVKSRVRRVGHATALLSLMASMPSLNFTPSITLPS